MDLHSPLIPGWRQWGLGLQLQRTRDERPEGPSTVRSFGLPRSPCHRDSWGMMHAHSQGPRLQREGGGAVPLRQMGSRFLEAGGWRPGLNAAVSREQGGGSYRNGDETPEPEASRASLLRINGNFAVVSTVTREAGIALGGLRQLEWRKRVTPFLFLK